jgi:hypothetical protein
VGSKDVLYDQFQRATQGNTMTKEKAAQKIRNAAEKYRIEWLDIIEQDYNDLSKAADVLEKQGWKKGYKAIWNLDTNNRESIPEAVMDTLEEEVFGD